MDNHFAVSIILVLWMMVAPAILLDFSCEGQPQWNNHPTDCHQFIRCVNSVPRVFSCGSTLVWDNTVNVCNWPRNVVCSTGGTDSPTVVTDSETTQVTDGETQGTDGETQGTDGETQGTDGETQGTDGETQGTDGETQGTDGETQSTDGETQRKDSPTEKTDTVPTGSCDAATCTIDSQQDCHCLGVTTPGGLQKEDTPKLVLISFDDAVTILNSALYTELFDGRKNPNGCDISTTYFVSDKDTDYALVRELFQKGHEIATHTISHRTPTSWWASASSEDLVDEIVAMKTKLEKEGMTNVVGYRNPFLQTAGDTTFKVLKENGFLYDSSLPVQFDKQWWPYTLNYGGPPQCVISPCPTSSFPGLWEVPMLQMKDAVAVCSMFDGCHRYASNTKEAVYDFFKTNFDRHYATKTAPFPLFTHASWMMHSAFTYRKEGFISFLDYLKTRNDVYIVGIRNSIEWMRDPTKLGDIQQNSGPLSC